MKKYLSFILALILPLLCLSGCQSEPSADSQQKVEAIFHDFATKDLDGNIVTERVLKEKKLTMINIWATFCGPCIREMPALANLAEEFENEIQVIGIVLDLCDANGNVIPDKKASALSIIEETGANYLHLAPSDSLNSAYLNEVMAVPETLFVDSEGFLIGESYSGARSEKEWRSIIGSFLEKTE